MENFEIIPQFQLGLLRQVGQWILILLARKQVQLLITLTLYLLSEGLRVSWGLFLIAMLQEKQFFIRT